jgi:DNA repair protein RadC
MIVATARTAAELLAPCFDSRESGAVAALHLGPRQGLLATTLAGMGGGGEVDLPVREILAAALRAGAVSLIVAHSSASGDPMPGEKERAAARGLAEAAAAAGLRLADYFVFAEGECRSFRQLGLL